VSAPEEELSTDIEEETQAEAPAPSSACIPAKFIAYAMVAIAKEYNKHKKIIGKAIESQQQIPELYNTYIYLKNMRKCPMTKEGAKP
jgi:hypothetical protein